MLTRRAGIGLLAAALTTASLSVLVGPRGRLTALPFKDPVEARIVTEIRLPRACLALVSGAALATAGMSFQALFRNALATPYTLGVSAGASLGTAIYVHAGVSASVGGVPGESFAAFAGAMIAIAFVYAIARGAGGFSPSTLLLAGVAVSFLFTSLILAIQYVGDVTTAFRIGRWLLGGLEVVGFTPVLRVLPFAAIGTAILLAMSRELDLLVGGDDSAAERGVAVSTVKQLVFTAASLMVGGVVATCGPIGFVGLVVPHVGRLLLGSKHTALGPFCVVGGGTFLLACDTVARSAVAPIELPVGIITALVGGPFFLTLLVRGHARQRLGGSRA